MRTATEQEKMVLEKRRQELNVEIEMRKFSETKTAEQNAEVVAKLNLQIDEQRSRRERAENASRRIRELLNEVTGINCVRNSSMLQILLSLRILKWTIL